MADPTTEDSIQTQIDEIDTQLASIRTAMATFISDPSKVVNYKIGERSFTKATQMSELREWYRELVASRKELVAALGDLPTEELTLYDDPMVDDYPDRG